MNAQDNVTISLSANSVSENVGIVTVTATATSALYANLTGLNPGTTYYWQVRAYYSATSQFGSWSAINSFVSHGTGTLSLPVLSYPIDGVEVYTTSPIKFGEYLYFQISETPF